jgi:hypothetical protein
MEALRDSGVIEKQGKQPEAPKGPSESISFKDLPPEGKAQMAQKVGIELSPETIRRDEAQQTALDTALKVKQMENKQQPKKLTTKK